MLPSVLCLSFHLPLGCSSIQQIIVLIYQVEQHIQTPLHYSNCLHYICGGTGIDTINMTLECILHVIIENFTRKATISFASQFKE